MKKQQSYKVTMTEVDRDAVKQNLNVLTQWSGEAPQTIVTNFKDFLELYPINPKGRKMDHGELFDYYEALYNISVDNMAQKLQNSQNADEKQKINFKIHEMISQSQENPVLPLVDLHEDHKVTTLGLLAMLTKL